MTTKLMKPIRVYAPITRVDPATRIVEGYCYVNAVVGDGIDLTRKSMVKASEDYMKWGAIRAMHQPVAAGTAEAVTWDDKGCFLRAKITDDAEWAKCENGTYKGFSVGVNPVVMRGNKTETVKWIENSLVDRPFDEDASFVIARAEGLGEDAIRTEVEVTMLDEERTETALTIPVIADVTRMKTKKLAKMAKKIGKVSAALSNQYRDAQAELTKRGIEVKKGKATLPAPAPAVIPTAPSATPAIDAAVLTRMTTMEASITRLQAALGEKDKALKASKKEIKRLGAMPAPGNLPVRFPAATGIDRTFTANEMNADTGGTDIAALRTQYTELVKAAEKEPDMKTRVEMSARIGFLGQQLSELGG